MTIKQAFGNFIHALTGQTPAGNNIAEVINDAANKVGTITGTDGFDLSELNTQLEAMSDRVDELEAVNPVAYEADDEKSFLLNSSTADSTKQYRVTVDDTGTLTATEIVVAG